MKGPGVTMTRRQSAVLALGCAAIPLALLQGCATGPPFVEITDVPADKGLVYLYRPATPLGCAVIPPITARGKTVTSLRAGGYYPYLCQPGEAEFTATTEATSSITIDVKAQRAYYVKETINVGFFVGRPHLMEVPAETAKAEIKDCRKEEPSQ